MEWWVVAWDCDARQWSIVNRAGDQAFEAEFICIQSRQVTSVALAGELHVQGFGHWLHEGSEVFHIHD